MPLSNKIKLLFQQYIDNNYIAEFISYSNLEKRSDLFKSEEIMQESTRSLEDVLDQVHGTF